MNQRLIRHCVGLAACIAVSGCNAIIGNDDKYTVGAQGNTPTPSAGTGGAPESGTGGQHAMPTGGGGSGGSGGAGGPGAATSGSGGAGGGTPASSSSSTSSGGPTACAGAGNIGSLQDNFNDNTMDPTKWGRFGSGASETSGELRLGAADSGYYSVQLYSLEECSASIKAMNTTQSGVTAVFQLKYDNGAGEIVFTQSNDGAYHSIQFEVKRNGGQITALSRQDLFFNAVDQGRWRFREESGRLYFETSNGGGSWNIEHEIATADLGFPIDRLRVQMSVSGPVSAGNPVRFDDLNL